jgi:hypothetical protein
MIYSLGIEKNESRDGTKARILKKRSIRRALRGQ